MNRLTEIDLTPLTHCEQLRELRLDGNLYNSIDLQPLASCQNIESLVVDDVDIIAPDLPNFYFDKITREERVWDEEEK